MPAETTKAASELVQRDAESRNQWLSLHEDLQTERSEIGRQRDLLEDDRRDWAARQRSDPIIAAAINAAGLLAACSLPLILMALLLWPRKPEPASDRDAVCDILVDELVTDALRIDRDPGEGSGSRIHRSHRPSTRLSSTPVLLGSSGAGVLHLFLPSLTEKHNEHYLD